MLSALAVLLPLWCAVPAVTPSVTSTVTLAGDSVVVVLAVTDNTAPQPVAVDSVEFTALLQAVSGSSQTVRVAKAPGTTSARFAWPLTLWTPNNTQGGPVSVRLGRISSACAGGVCWSAPTTKGTSSAWAWSYLLDARAPNPAEAGALSVQSSGLN